MVPRLSTGSGATRAAPTSRSSNSRIAAIGEIGSDADEVIDAGGLALMPGIIDIHTHYDAQVTWDPTLSPSPSLGVTTAVMGNCGFGIVPSPPPSARPDHAQPRGRRRHGSRRAARRHQLASSSPSPNISRGARRRPLHANLAVLVGHSAVRTAVMGEDASVRKEPTAAEMAEMKRLVAEAMQQGAIGLGASYSLNHSG